MFFSEEINRYGVRSFIRLIRGLADTVILLGHPSVSGMQSGRGYSGSTHWNNAVRSRLYFTSATAANGSEPDTDLRYLEMAKSNRSKAKQKLALRWTENGFVRDDKAAAGLDDLSRRLKAEEVFLKLVKLFNEQRRPISPNRSPSHAPTLFSKHPDREGCSKADFADAMEILLCAGKIEVIEEGPPSALRQRLRVKGN
jgi:RecA-family ATPase